MSAAMPIPTRMIIPNEDPWREMFTRLRRVAVAMVGPGRGRDARADDLAQGTIARLLRAQRGPREFAYARRTLVRLYLDEERSLRRRLARRRVWQSGKPRVHLDSDRLATAETIALAQRAMHSLSPLQRSAFTLRVIEEMSYREIAAVLDTSADTARSSVHAARKRLSAILGEMQS